MEAQVKYRFADIGHWLARCDHSTNVIELHSVEYPKLSPLYRDYVWIHECVHLLYNVYDEAECNRITDEIFVQRATSERDRKERERFIQASNGSIVETKRKDTNPMAIVLALTILLVVFMNLK